MTGLALLIIYFVVYVVAHGRGRIYVDFALSSSSAAPTGPNPSNPTSGGGLPQIGGLPQLPEIGQLPQIPGIGDPGTAAPNLGGGTSGGVPDIGAPSGGIPAVPE